MRKERIIFWLISFIICIVLFFIYKKEESKIPDEEKSELPVYCSEELREDIKKIIESSSIGKKNRVVFEENKGEAEIILTDRITVSDNGYERIGWSPLIVVFDNTEKMDNYILEAENGSYTIKFDKIIEDTVKGVWKDTIYCPKPNTREGELFFDFLLININYGKYPSNEEELEHCTRRANEFLNSSTVIQMDPLERLKYKKTVEGELYIVFEKDITKIASYDSYKFTVSYPTNTILYELYYYCSSNNKEELEKELKKEKFWEGGNELQYVMNLNYIRGVTHTSAYKHYKGITDNFSYVEIPLKEE